MLKELSKYEDLGTPKLFKELLSQFQKRNGIWDISSIDEYLYDRVIDGRMVFDGCLPFLVHVGIVGVSTERATVVDRTFLTDTNEKQLKIRMLEKLLSESKKDSDFVLLFSPENLSYDVTQRKIRIRNAAFRLRYSNFKQLLIELGFLVLHPDSRVSDLFINNEYRKAFESFVLPIIREKKLTPEELCRRMDENMVNGEMAEKFVVEFEKVRLQGRKNMEIEKISDYDVSAGYDIVSFESISSFRPDRFIEVKCFISAPRFYWSRNEIDVAKIKRDEYYLYLVDRNGIGKNGYSPIIIKNPYKNVLENKEWNKGVEKYHIFKTN